MEPQSADPILAEAPIPAVDDADERQPSTPLVVITGPRQAGKTTACRRIAAAAAARGWTVAGVLAPALFQGGRKVGIMATDLRSGESRLLATRRSAADGGLGYEFDEGTLAWADGVVASAVPCDLLVVDEIGPLELATGRGLVSALAVLRGGMYRRAVVVVRPELVAVFEATVGLPCRVARVGGLSLPHAFLDAQE